MDDFDKKILAIVQRNNRLTHEQIGEQLNMSSSAVRRRLNRLRKDGVIIADVAIVDPQRSQVTIITSIRLARETRSIYEAFKTRMKACPEVAQCYTVSGEADFIMVAHFPDLQSYEAWIDTHILSDDSVQRSATNIVYSRVKFETAVSV